MAVCQYRILPLSSLCDLSALAHRVRRKLPRHIKHHELTLGRFIVKQ